jgi:hypothetical protein
MEEQNNLQEDLDKILVTGAGRSETREYLIAKGYDLKSIENELDKIPFVTESKPELSEFASTSLKKGTIVFMISAVLVIFGFLFSVLYHFTSKKRYAKINVTICNISKTKVRVETNLGKTFCSPFVSGGCLGTVIEGGLPTDYLLSDQVYIKISVDGKSTTFHSGPAYLAIIPNLLSRASIERGSLEEGYFSDTEVQSVTYNITQADIDQCK